MLEVNPLLVALLLKYSEKDRRVQAMAKAIREGAVWQDPMKLAKTALMFYGKPVSEEELHQAMALA